MIVSIGVFVGCSKKPVDKTVVPSTPVIQSVDKTSVVFGTTVVITGSNFSPDIKKNKVYFNNVLAVVSSATSSRLETKVPLGAGSGTTTISVDGGETITGPAYSYALSSQVVTVAGSATPSGAGLFEPYSLAFNNSNSTLYIANFGFNKILTIDASGTLATFAGGNMAGASDGSGTSALFSGPISISLDGAGNLFVGEQNNELRKITPTGAVSTITATNNVKLDVISAVAVDKNGNIYLARDHAIIKVDATGAATAFAGKNPGSSPIKDGTGTDASFGLISGLTVDNNGTLYVSELEANLIRKVTPGAVVTFFAGGGSINANGQIVEEFNHPQQIAIGKDDNLYVADSGHNLIKKIAADGSITVIAGSGQAGSQDGPLLQATFASPHGIAIDDAGNIYVSDAGTNLIREIVINK